MSLARRAIARLARALNARRAPPPAPPAASDPTLKAPAPEAERPEPERGASARALAGAHGVRMQTEEGGRRVWERAGLRTERAFEVDDTTRALAPEEREALWIEALAARLVLDHGAASWSPEREIEPRTHAARTKQEVAPASGRRLVRLVPRGVVEATTARGLELASLDFGASHSIIYTLEIGRALHALSQSEAAAWAERESREELHRRCLSNLFYQSYKVRPSERGESEEGRSVHYKTAEGLGMARLLLFPDFDLDAARAGAWVGAASLDEISVLIPREPDAPGDQVRRALEEILRARRDGARRPAPPIAFRAVRPPRRL